MRLTNMLMVCFLVLTSTACKPNEEDTLLITQELIDELDDFTFYDVYVNNPDFSCNEDRCYYTFSDHFYLIIKNDFTGLDFRVLNNQKFDGVLVLYGFTDREYWFVTSNSLETGKNIGECEIVNQEQVCTSFIYLLNEAEYELLLELEKKLYLDVKEFQDNENNE